MYRYLEVEYTWYIRVEKIYPDIPYMSFLHIKFVCGFAMNDFSNNIIVLHMIIAFDAYILSIFGEIQ